MPKVPLLSLKNATVRRGQTAIVDQVSLELYEGESVAVLGPNGAGKSSLLKLIDKENYPLAKDGSYVSVLGRDQWDVSELRTIIGIVTPSHIRRFEDAEIDSLTCVLAGFFAATRLYPNMVVTPEMEAAALESLEVVQAAHLRHRLMATLSTGEARRILIARALALRPRALLLDEPTAGLDIVAAQDFLGIIEEIEREGTTIILVTHHIEEVIPSIDRVLLLKNGRLFFDGSKTEALTSSMLSNLFGRDLQVRQEGQHYFACLTR